MDSEREQGQQGQIKRRGRPIKTEHRRIKLYGSGSVYMGKQAIDLGFTGTLIPIFTPEAILLVRPGTTARVLRRCIEVAALRMLAEEESGVGSEGEGVERLARWVRSRLEGVLLEVDECREAAVERRVLTAVAQSSIE